MITQSGAMSKEWMNPGSITLRRLVLWTLGLFPVVLLSLLFVFWLHSQIPEWFYWKAGLIFLIALEVGYVAMVTAAAVAILVLGSLALFRRRMGPIGTPLARGLLLCSSLLLAAVAAEAASAAWRFRAHRSSAMPVGGFGRERGTQSEEPVLPRVTEVPLPTDFSDPPGDRDIDLVVVGESSAEGVPYDRWLSIASILHWKLTEAIPDRPVRPKTLATSGQTLELQHKKLKELSRRPDILIVYCGHNEFVARLPTTRDRPHYFDESLPGAGDVLIDWIEQSSPLCGLIHQNAEKCRIAIPPPKYGDRRLVDKPSYTQTEYTTLLLDFRRRLESIVSFAERVGALPVLIIPAGNDAGFEPSRSFLPARTSRGERAAFEHEFLEARRTEASDPAASIERYRGLLSRAPGFAETHYRLGKLLETKGEWEAASREYVAARDLDGFPMRCLSPFQDAYREVAARHDCILIDMQSYFHAIGRHGLLDDDLFQDAIHPSLRGQIALAQAVLQSLHARRAFGWPRNSVIPSIDPAQCTAHFRMGPDAWRKICFWGMMFSDMAAPLTYDPAPRLRKRLAYAQAADRIEAGEAPESLGLPNVGIPAAVPTVPVTEARSGPSSDPVLRSSHGPDTNLDPAQSTRKTSKP
jgi:hypothetical protein